jgi:hypothetical protein
MTNRLRRAMPVALAISALAAASGCGGGDDGAARFAEDGFSISFEHPSSFDEIEDVSIASTAGAASERTTARGLDEQNLILVSRYDLDTAVSSANVARIKPEVDAVVSQAVGRTLSGAELEIGPLPGYEYRFGLDSQPPVRSRLIVLFDGETEYTLNCQSTQDLRDEIDAACERAVATLERR